MNVPHGVNHGSRPAVRQGLPDQLRGIALLGIIFVNMPFLGLTNDGLIGFPRETPADDFVAFAIVTLAQGKFYLLFAFLFGYSFTLILRDNSATQRARFRRRLVGLAILGMLHATLFFIGDILLSYAVLGFALLVFASRSTRTAVIGAIVAYVVGLLVLGLAVLSFAGPSGSGGAADATGLISDPAALDAALRSGFVDGAAARIWVLPEALLTQIVLNWSPALTMFLLGMVTGRRNLLARPEEYRRLWQVLVVIAVVIGLPLAALSAWLQLVTVDPTGFAAMLGVALGFGSAPLLTGGYVGGAALLTRTRALIAAAPAGRMSLTGYLGESIVLAAIFCGWGLGLFGQLSIAAAALITFGVWMALELFAHAWLRRFAYGPFEWALRCWSTWMWLPIRKRKSPTLPPDPVKRAQDNTVREQRSASTTSR